MNQSIQDHGGIKNYPFGSIIAIIALIAAVFIGYLFIDFDSDGYRNINDCGDWAKDQNPEQPERFDGKDNNCNGEVDESPDGRWYLDKDGDGQGNERIWASAAKINFESFRHNMVANHDDCNDNDALTHQGAPETYNGRDDDCDGEIDEPNDCGQLTQQGKQGSTEVFDGVDNDCDDKIDETNSGIWYRDCDQDGYGNKDLPVQYQFGMHEEYHQCSKIVAQGNDCNDSSETTHPDHHELFDGLDNNCDGQIDENFRDEWEHRNEP